MIKEPILLVTIYVLLAIIIRFWKPNLFTGALLAIVMIASCTYIGKTKYPEVLESYHWMRGQVLAISSSGHSVYAPQVGSPYPDLELLDQNGSVTRLSDFKGKTIVIEPFGSRCPACIAFSGGHRKGGYRGMLPQRNLKSFEQYAKQYGGVDLGRDDIVFVQLFLYDHEMQPPNLREVKRWADHFDFKRSEYNVVLQGTAELQTELTKSMVPGFQLIDRNFVLRADSTGHKPQHNFYTEFILMLKDLTK
ncbi:MAG: hypothetical protein ACI9G1_005070 [Pirellulaceae bacterium]|jgi:hypothetical protein